MLPCALIKFYWLITDKTKMTAFLAKQVIDSLVRFWLNCSKCIFITQNI